MLEEHIRELELRSEERLQTEQKRNKDSIQRLEREKQLEIENYSIKYETIILLKTINKHDLKRDCIFVIKRSNCFALFQ